MTQINVLTCTKGHTNLRTTGRKRCRECHREYCRKYYLSGKYKRTPRHTDLWYKKIHKWLRRNFYNDKTVCGHCGVSSTVRQLEFANISGKYLRAREDYIILCKICHHAYDSASLAHTLDENIK